MDKDYWNRYFMQEDNICLRYKYETGTKPVTYFKNAWGNTIAQDIKITIEPHK